MRKIIHWNVKMMLSQRDMLLFPVAGLFYLAVSYIQLAIMTDPITLRHIQVIVYGGVAAGDFSLLPLTKMGVYMAIYVRVLAQVMRQKDRVLKYCVNRCASCRMWAVGELAALLLLASMWAIQLTFCEGLISLFYHVPFPTGVDHSARIHMLLIDMAAAYSIAILFAALNNMMEKTINMVICMLCAMAALTIDPVGYIMPFGFCFGLRTWALSGAEGIGVIKVWSIFGIYFFVWITLIFLTQGYGLKRRILNEQQ